MNTVTVTRVVDASPSAVEAAMTDVVAFLRGTGFDEVRRDGDLVEIENRVGLLTVELLVELVADTEAVLAYEAREGMFETMRTAYTVESHGSGAVVTAETTFALDVAVVGDLLDATVIERQREKELTTQFDWLEEHVE